jgi:hypothetical protein
MDDPTPGQPGLRSPAEYGAAIDRCLAQMRRLREQMDRDQAEIDRLKAETQAILRLLKAT